MKQNNLFVFGCSYSAPYLKITEKDTYGYLLADKLNMIPHIKARAASGLQYSQNELIKSLPLIKENDVVIFQFTFHFRLEFWDDIHNEDSWHSTAGFYQMADLVKTHMVNSPLKSHADKELEILLKYNAFWRIQEKPILIKPTQNILHYLEQEKGVRYICMYVSHEEDEYFVDKNTIHLPVSCCNDDNNGMMEYIAEKKARLGDEFPIEHKDDPHPGLVGHKKIAELLEKELL
jgi:hypothetical protein